MKEEEDYVRERTVSIMILEELEQDGMPIEYDKRKNVFSAQHDIYRPLSQFVFSYGHRV